MASSYTVVGEVTPFSNATAVVMILKVEPGM